MKENFNVKGKNGSIAIFVLVGLLFMSAFLMISYGYNVNKSKIAKEQFNSISDIYSYKDGDANAYDRAYTALRKKNKQTFTEIVEDSSVIELKKTYEGNLVNYRIYGIGYNIPDEYQVVEYIESTGTQYIDTGVMLSDSLGFEFEAECTSTTKRDGAFFGIRNPSNGSDGVVCWFNTISGKEGFCDFAFRYGENNVGSLSITKDRIHFSSSDNSNLVIYNINDNFYSYSKGQVSYNKTILLMAINKGDAIDSRTFQGKTYYFQIYNNKYLIRYMIPCYRKIDNVIGMYDIIKNEFYTNQGTGTFIKGADIEELNNKGLGDLITNSLDKNYRKYKISVEITNSENISRTIDIILDTPLYKNDYIDFKSKKIIRTDGTEEVIDLPEILLYEDYTKIEVKTDEAPFKIEVEYEGYTIEKNEIFFKQYKEVKYIESIGTQYIDTGYKANNNTNIIYDFEYLSGKSSYMPILGQRAVVGQKLFVLWIQSSTGKVVINFDTTDTSAIENSNGFGRHVYKNVGGKFYLDDTLLTEIDYSKFQTDYPLSIFGLRTSVTDTETRSLCGRVYSLKIYESDEVVRNFIPCKRNSDGEVGLYDTVNNVFYTNAGTGEFIAGPEV